jgi:hypothetical protein
LKEIRIRQNEPDILILQFLQRKTYDESKKYWRYGWYVSWIMLVCSLIFQFLNLESSATVIVIIAVLDVLIVVLEYLSDKKMKIGATAKYYIDNTLFELSNAESKFTIKKIRELAIECSEKNNTSYEIQIRNTGKDNPPGLKDWYTVSSSDDMNQTIFMCQEENSWWQSKLSNLYMKCLVVTIGILIIISLLILCIFGITMETFVLILLTNLGIIGKAIRDAIAMYKYNIIQVRIHENIEMIKRMSTIDISQLQLLQDNINTLREVNFLVPDFLHKKKSTKLHSLYSGINRE